MTLLRPAELEVLKLMAEGWNDHAIAERRVITVRAVRNYTSGIYHKLQAKPDQDKRVAAVLWYLKQKP